MRAKQVFSKCRVPFERINVGQDEKAAAYIEKINNGFKSLPTIVFPGNSVLVEPTNAVLEKILLSLKVREN
jgi:mycoredoxin